MRINGIQLSNARVEVVVIPRQEGDIVFKAEPVRDWDHFDKLCPKPSPPSITKRGETQPTPNYEDKTFLKRERDRHLMQMNYLYIKSLMATEGLEWDTVNINKPETWKNWQEDLKNSGFTFPEIGRLQELVNEANGLNQIKIDEATKDFLATQAAAQKQENSQNSGSSNTQSGEHASD